MISSLQNLPIELVYRILDHLDQSVIIFSCRDVCTRLDAIIDTYRRYQVTSSFIIFIIVFYFFIQIFTTLDLQYKKSHYRDTKHLAITLQRNQVIYLSFLFYTL